MRGHESCALSLEWMRLLDTRPAEENRTASTDSGPSLQVLSPTRNWLGKTQGRSQPELLMELFIFHWWASYADLLASGFHHRRLMCWAKQQPLLETAHLPAPPSQGHSVYSCAVLFSSLPAAVRGPAHPRHRAGSEVEDQPHTDIYQCNVHYTCMLCNVLRAYNARVCYICSIDLYRVMYINIYITT